MKKEEFLELCKAHMQNFSDGFRPDGEVAEFGRSAEVGGVSGGSCWESSNPERYVADLDDPGIGPVLDSFLEAHFPHITFLQYRKLERQVRVSEHSEREYYGNRTDYKRWALSFEDLWDAIASADAVEG